MKSSVVQPTSSARSMYLSLVKKEYRKGYEIPIIPYQTAGILSKVLWTSKDHILRIVPGHNKAGQILRQNINVNEYSEESMLTDFLSDTFMKSTIVNGFGTSDQTFITDFEPGSADEVKYGGDTLIHWFVRNICYTLTANRKSRFSPIPEWSMWNGKNGSIKYDREAVLMQALIFCINGRNNQNEDRSDMVDEDGDILPLFSVVAMDNQTSIANLLQALVAPMDPNLPLDAITNNKYGGMAELEGNKLFLNSTLDAKGKYSVLKPSVQAGGKGWVPTPFSISEEAAKSLWQPWGDILHYMTANEQALLLAAEYGADTVNYVIGTDPKFATFEMPDTIKAAGYGRYAKFLDGVTEVAQKTTISGKGMAAPLSKGLGATKPVARPAQQEPAALPPLTSAPAGAMGTKLGSIPKGSGVDQDAIKRELEKMKAVKAKTEEQDPAAMAEALLNDPDFAETDNDNGPDSAGQIPF